MPLRRILVAATASMACLAVGALDTPPPKAPAPAPPANKAPVPSAVPAPAPAPAPPPPPASKTPRAAAIEAATPPGGGAAPGPSDLLIRVQVLLDRAHFSPGVIDGRTSDNLTRALTAFEAANGLPADGAPGAPVLAALTKADSTPVTQDYAITAGDEAGPFLGRVPATFKAMSRLKTLGYASPVQELSERFHMSEALLRELNPNANFRRAGTVILVARPGSAGLTAPVAKVEVDKANNQLRAWDAGGKILATFPATVGSTERPAPSGQWAVRAVARNPVYIYDPRRLTFGARGQGRLSIAPGPNNPVGTTWIALTKDTYGIHGAPNPDQVGKTASHGCVRLTNWDAATLGAAVAKGTPVVFLGETTRK